MSEEEIHDAVAVAIADVYLCQPKDMTWEDRTDELARAAISAMRGLYDNARIARLNEVPPA